MSSLKCFMLLAPTALAGVAIGGGLCWMLDLAPLTPPAWAAFGVGALAAMAAGALMLHRAVMAPPRRADEAAATLQAAAADQIETQRRLRHDIRGALSPALLMADRLLTHADPAVQRAGDIMVQAVERAAALLSEAPKPGATPPGSS